MVDGEPGSSPHYTAGNAIRRAIAMHPGVFIIVFFGILSIGAMIGLRKEPVYEALLIVSIGNVFRANSLHPVEYGEVVREKLDEKLRLEAGNDGVINGYHVMRARHKDRFYAGARIRGTERRQLLRYASRLRYEVIEHHRELFAAGDSLLSNQIEDMESRLRRHEQEAGEFRSAGGMTIDYSSLQASSGENDLRARIRILQETRIRQDPTEISVRVSSYPLYGVDYYLTVYAMIGFVAAVISACLACRFSATSH